MKKNIKRDWNRMENNCINILKFLSEHPMEGIGYNKIAKELLIPFSTVHYLIKSGKCEQVGFKYGYVTKLFEKKKPVKTPNILEVIKWDISETQKMNMVSQDDNFIEE